MTTIDITPLSRHRRKNGTKGFTPGDLKYLDWIKERDREAKKALPKVTTKKRRSILAKIKAEG
jgi:hypothetical protein